MKKIFYVFALSLLTLMSCSNRVDNIITSKNNYSFDSNIDIPTLGLIKKPEEGFNKNSSYDEEKYSLYLNKINDFACDISSRLDVNSSFAFSPISLFNALTLACEVSNNLTRDEILSCLNMSYQEIFTYTKILNEKLNFKFDYEDKILSMQKNTNSIWINKNLNYNIECLENLSTNYNCYSYQVDFKNENEKANSEIRNFVKENTYKLIDQDFKIGYDTLFALVNTIYAKDVWNYNGFELNLTKELFLNKMVDFLTGNYQRGQIYKNDLYSHFYINSASNYKLSFIVPNSNHSLKEIYNKETLLNISNMKEYHHAEGNNRYFTRCLFPKFNVSSNFELSSYLQDMNIKSIFSDNADTSSLLKNENSRCSSILQSTKLNVDEVGFEGAAVTIAINDTTSLPNENDIYQDFKVDKEFIYLLQDSNGVIVFNGIVNKI